ncbi:isoprenylcysteine carboxyl methyltransferase [Ceratobasidium sp. AG-Ba]|nr:isoprenylcysteine carboxyl methyltransferase [Ceratobasidium sp. AG-Ba]
MSFHSYVAGLNIRITDGQALNCLGWVAEKEGGRRIEPSPALKTKAQILTSAHGLGFLASAAAFLLSLPLNHFVMPEWLAKYKLPPLYSPLACTVLRIAASAGSVAISLTSASATKHLGSQWNYFGLRERPKVVKTGPYSIVRHPMYSCGIVLEVCFAGMFWNWMPLAVLGAVLIPAFVIKIPMEEKAILESKIGAEYKEYQKIVRWRLCPYLW